MLYRAAVTSVDVVWAVAVAVAFVSPKLQHTRNLCLSVYVSIFLFVRRILLCTIGLSLACFGSEPACIDFGLQDISVSGHASGEIASDLN